MWCRFWKTVHGRLVLETYYALKDDMTEDNIENMCEEWAYNDYSGHNAGYNYGFEEVEKPPKEWLLNKINVIENDIENNQKRLNDLKFWADTYSRRAKIDKISNNIKEKN